MKKTTNKHLIILACLLLISLYGKAQMTLQHTFTISPSMSAYDQGEVVNLSISGKKIMVVTDSNVLSFYNLDYSMWKTITIPSKPYIYPNGKAHLSPWGDSYGIFYPSEELFNLDPLLEVAVYYGTDLGTGAIFIINETGAAVDSIMQVNMTSWNSGPSVFTVYNTASGTFQAVVSRTTGVSVYSLPGTIPCDVCGNGLGLANEKVKQNGVSEPIPNPSSGQVKITFTLPDNVKQGQIDIYNMNGQKLKSFKVDKTFGYITVDDSEFPAGMYYYNLIADGEVSTTRKMLVIK